MRSTEEKREIFSMICGELGVPWEGDEVSTLRHSTSALPRRRSGIAF